MDFKVQHEIDRALWIYENNVVVFFFSLTISLKKETLIS